MIGANVDGCETSTTGTNNCGGCGTSARSPTRAAPPGNGAKVRLHLQRRLRRLLQNAPTRWVRDQHQHTVATAGAAALCANAAPLERRGLLGAGLHLHTARQLRRLRKDRGDFDGCETDTTSDNNCGGCGNVCTLNNGPRACNGTSCSYNCNRLPRLQPRDGPRHRWVRGPAPAPSPTAWVGNKCDTLHSVGAACKRTTAPTPAAWRGFTTATSPAPTQRLRDHHAQQRRRQNYVDCADPLGPRHQRHLQREHGDRGAPAWPTVGTDVPCSCFVNDVCLMRYTGADCTV